MGFGKRFFEALDKRNIEEVVKRNGCLIIQTVNSDYDENGIFLGTQFEQEYKESRNIAKEFVEKYNPENLSNEDYATAYAKGSLDWQN